MVHRRAVLVTIPACILGAVRGETRFRRCLQGQEKPMILISAPIGSVPMGADVFSTGIPQKHPHPFHALPQMMRTA